MRQKKDPSDNLKLETFCQSYIKDFNATAAALAAGYSKSSAANKGCILLKNTAIQRRLSELMDQKMKDLNVTRESVLEEIAILAFADLGHYAEWGTQIRTVKAGKRKGVKVADAFIILKDSKEIDSRAIQQVRMTRDGPAIKLFDKGPMLAILAKHFKLVADDNGIPGGGIPELARLTAVEIQKDKNGESVQKAG